jgi:hypothetical protein
MWQTLGGLAGTQMSFGWLGFCIRQTGVSTRLPLFLLLSIQGLF